MVDTELADYYATCAADATREGNYAKAEYYLDLALEEDPHSVLAHSNLGTLYSILGMWQDATRTYQKALRYAPDNPLLLFNLGTSYMETDDLEQAVVYLEQALEKDPQCTAAVFNLAMCYDQLGQFDEALAWYQRVVDLDPSDPDPIYNMADIYYRTRAFHRAEKVCKLALELFDARFRDTQVTPWLPPGEPLSREQLLADIALRKASALALMAWIQANQGKLHSALQSIRGAIGINPNKANWFMLMAEIHQKLGNYADARAAFARAQELDGVGAVF